MPPSNFFNAGMAEEDYESEDYSDDIRNFESILDISSVTYCQKRLKWHYRSRVEDLISFSNNNFYSNELMTFPQAKHKELDYGVDFYYVEGGIFDRGNKTNIKEAESIADLVFEHFKEYPERSLGVVAFSISQQEAIENIILKRREADSSYEEFFQSDKKEPFFVKNLETVQGDERDTIIFSIAYAKDISGKFLHNFGPLNKQGGERRLNVAISRAKFNVKVVSSIKSTDIDVNRISNEGARLLRDYLYYAENGKLNNIKAIQHTDANAYLFQKAEFIDDIYDYLTEKGYKADKNVGCSSYKIDLAIRHPEESYYILGIECDGENFRSLKTTRDRERLRREVLERLGWNYYRIW
jgi:superfamily I DNA and/or RNA helicase